MLKNWKTTTAGVAAAIGYLAYKYFTEKILTGDDFILAGGLMGMGALSKDHDKTGGTSAQPTISNPPTK